MDRQASDQQDGQPAEGSTKKAVGRGPYVLNNPSAMAKRAAKPAAIAVQAIHRLCWYVNSNTAFGASKPLSNPRLIPLRFFNLRPADTNQDGGGCGAGFRHSFAPHFHVAHQLGWRLL